MPKPKVKKDQYIWARSPVRLDLAGGWSDTPPYTFRHGGKVVNMAVDLNDELPVQVYIRRDDNPRIKLTSIDLGISETVTNLDHIEKFRDPNLPFANIKAALFLIGFNKKNIKKPLVKYLKEIGGGFDITTFVAVPKGSGLGVSSILGATILGALHKLFDDDHDHHRILNETLKLERMFTSGGGWQDQAGGMIGGIKYLQSSPCKEDISVVEIETEHLDPFIFKDNEYQKCFTLYYTGITRLAKNVLQKVVERVESGDENYLSLHSHIKSLAERARASISKRDIKELADIIKESWEANKEIHWSTTSNRIDELLKSVRHYYIGAKLLGAGGGGYCLFISESPKQAERLREKLKEIRKGNGRVVDWNINTNGLRVSLS